MIIKHIILLLLSLPLFSGHEPILSPEEKALIPQIEEIAATDYSLRSSNKNITVKNGTILKVPSREIWQTNIKGKNLWVFNQNKRGKTLIYNDCNITLRKFYFRPSIQERPKLKFWEIHIVKDTKKGKKEDLYILIQSVKGKQSDEIADVSSCIGSLVTLNSETISFHSHNNLEAPQETPAIDFKKIYGDLPLHRLIMGNDIENLRLALSLGIADINKRDSIGNTPLHVAATLPGLDNASIVQELLKVKNIDLYLVNDNHHSALSLAIASENTEAANALLMYMSINDGGLNLDILSDF